MMMGKDLTWYNLPKVKQLLIILETETEVGAGEWVQVLGEHNLSMAQEIKVVDIAKAVKI